MKIGLERSAELKKVLSGKRVSLIANMASVDANFNHAIDLLKDSGALLSSLMGPQHGFAISKQDNMKESDNTVHPEYEVPIYSLYGTKREPEDFMLEDIDAVVFDLQDVGARYYTFIYTMALAMKACAKNNKQFVVLDRPNPINGIDIEGGIVQSGYESFVGMYPISIRHGMTVGELAEMFNTEFSIGCDLHVVKMDGWDRKKYFDELNREWVIPSPNMPLVSTALVYPGQCLLEATNASEGRGTTRPFEIFGTPYIEHNVFMKHLCMSNLEGCYFRPVCFEPTFNKYASQLCSGFQIHVTDRKKFKPVKTSLSILYALYSLYHVEFSFSKPPYEYEFKKMPIDILTGSDLLRNMMQAGAEIEDIFDAVDQGKSVFVEQRQKYLLY